MYSLYILSCVDGSYFVGICKNLKNRVEAHQSGTFPNLPTFNKRPVQLVYDLSFTDIQKAIMAQQIIQQWPDEKTEALIDGKIGLQLKPTIHKSAIKQERIELPIAYLPPISWFRHLKKSSHIILAGGEMYRKQTYRTRATIFGANGLQNLVVPVTRPNGRDTKLSEVLINYDENWQKDHVKALVSAYGKAPYFDYYGDAIIQLIEKKHEKLVDLNIELIRYLLKAFEIQSTIEINQDLSNLPIPTKEEMIPKNRTRTIIHPYYQVLNKGPFETNLSAIDALFNNRYLPTSSSTNTLF